MASLEAAAALVESSRVPFVRMVKRIWYRTLAAATRPFALRRASTNDITVAG